MKVSNVKPWQQISKQKQRKPLKGTCSKLKFEPMKHGPTNRATGVVNIFTTSAWIHDILSCMKRTSWSSYFILFYFILFSFNSCLFFAFALSTISIKLNLQSHISQWKDEHFSFDDDSQLRRWVVASSFRDLICFVVSTATWIRESYWHFKFSCYWGISTKPQLAQSSFFVFK